MEKSGIITKARYDGFVPFTVALLFCFALLGLVSRELSLPIFDVRLLGRKESLGLLLLTIAAIAWMYRRRTLPGFSEWALASVACLGVYLASDLLSRPFSYFTPQWRALDVVGLGILATAGFVSVGQSSKRSFALLAVVLAFAVFLSTEFLSTAAGRMLFSDDHPSFLYRLQLLVDEFPRIPFYNTDWNGGLIAREFFASGILNIFFLTAPFLATGLWGDLSSVHSAAQAYNFVIVYGFFFVAPVCIWWAARMFGGSREEASLSALVSLGFSLSYLEWLLRYGTLGFCLSVMLFPLAFALCAELFLQRRSPLLFFAALVATSLCLLWTVGLIGFLPLGVAALMTKHFALKQRLLWLSAFAGVFLALNGVWLLTFIQESKVLSFVSGAALPGSHSVASTAPDADSISAWLKEGWKLLQESLIRTNPLVILFGLLGVFTLERRFRFPVLGSVFLLLVGAIMTELKPQLELKRLVFFALILLCAFCGQGVVRALSAVQQRSRLVYWFSSILVLGFLFGSPINLSAVLRDRSDIKLRFSPRELEELSTALHGLDTPGRTAVLGFILHELGSSSGTTQDGGHIAPLAAFSNRELYASHFYHARWSSVDPIPHAFRARGEQGIEEFLDLIFATTVITHSRDWSEYCHRLPRYKLLSQTGRFKLWKRETSASAFLQGEGRVERTDRRSFHVRPMQSVSVLKYRFHPRLRVLDSITGAGELLTAEQLSQITISPTFAFDEDLGGKRTDRVDFVQLTLPESFIGLGVDVRLGDD